MRAPSPLRGVPNVSLATLNEDGSPWISPVATLFLSDDMQGIYFEQYPRHMSRNLKRGQRICVLIVNTNPMLWGGTIL